MFCLQIKFAGIDLITEGITTSPALFLSAHTSTAGIDLITEGITTFAFRLFKSFPHPMLELT